MDIRHIPLSSRGDLWFEDGNIILLANPEDSDIDALAFKVHRGVLARHSEVFRSMFEGSHPPSNDEKVENCPVIRMHDIPLELSNLLKVLYDGPNGLYVNYTYHDSILIHCIITNHSKGLVMSRIYVVSKISSTLPASCGFPPSIASRTSGYWPSDILHGHGLIHSVGTITC
jgi:hypothetical protein